MAEPGRSSRRPLLVMSVLVVLPVLARCSDGTHEGKSRLLDEACADNSCAVQGSGRVTSGPTADSTGVRVGPGQGVVTIPIPAFSHVYDNSYEIELLVAGRGAAQARLFMKLSSCTGVTGGTPTGSGCLVPVESPSTLLLNSNFQWLAVGGASGADAGSTFQGLVVQVSVPDDGSTISVADMRYTTYASAVNCSVSAVGFR